MIRSLIFAVAIGAGGVFHDAAVADSATAPVKPAIHVTTPSSATVDVTPVQYSYYRHYGYRPYTSYYYSPYYYSYPSYSYPYSYYYSSPYNYSYGRYYRPYSRYYHRPGYDYYRFGGRRGFSFGFGF